ncbi:MAG: DUF6110 family protein [Eubacteriales bacterium]|nr:DUF6110 family protein [Eubacteriales bacterium]
MVKSALFFVGGMLFGSAGFKAMGTEEAKKLYVRALALGLRGYDAAARKGQQLQSELDDIVNEAREMNNQRRIETAEENGELEF